MSCRLPLRVALHALAVAWAVAQGDTTASATSGSTSSNTTVFPTTIEVSSTNIAPQLTTAAPDPNAHSLQWVVLHAENPSGLLADGTGCTDFGFAGVQCSLTFVYEIKTSPMSATVVNHTDTFSYGNSGDNTQLYNTPLSGDAFEGFNLNGKLKGNDKDIASFNFNVPNDQTKGIITLTDPITGAAVKIAWKSGLKAPVTTAQPTTQQSTAAAETTATPISEETAGTGTTPVATTVAPVYPDDCDAYTAADRKNGVKTIYIGGNSTKNISVYCEFGSSGALTTIQSRGNNDLTSFSNDFETYKEHFGTAGKGNNFWFGLENMNAITTAASYNLYVEVCCGTVGTQQRYHNFTIGGSSTNYTLNATADTPGIGLALVALGETNAADIGAPFSTRNTYSADLDLCEALTTYDDNFNEIISNGTGGWWFGSCANNLNGEYIHGTDSTACNVTAMSATTGTGVALRTNPGIINPNGPTYLDHKSYTRVRMAIYKASVPLQGISSTDFCS